jgi:hypothetical protein
VVEITDVSQHWKEEIAVEIPDGKYVHRLSIEATGELSEPCTINNITIPSGKVDITIYQGDHYSNKYLIDYLPKKGNQGTLKLKLTFFYNF